jgi:pSer/pThr/pTyr-binding forkhead associated (FHA) protein
MHVLLTVVGGKADRRQVRVKVPVLIGRSREAGLVITHPMVSRRHCELYVLDGMLRVRDLGSLNGVFVGGKRVVEAPLPPQSEFSVGPLTLRVDYSPEMLQSGGTQPATPPPPPPPGAEFAADWGEIDLDLEARQGSPPAHLAAEFPAISSPLSEEKQILFPSSAESAPPASHQGDEEAPYQEEAEKKSARPQTADLPTLFPEDLPPDLM